MLTVCSYLQLCVYNQLAIHSYVASYIAIIQMSPIAMTINYSACMEPGLAVAVAILYAWVTSIISIGPQLRCS